MKIIITLLFSFFFIFQITYAYSITDVSEHDSRKDCWVIFEESVYDISPYIAQHDEYLDITDWCGRDITEDFKDKGGLDIDHKGSSYSLLETLYIGKVTEEKSDLVPDSLKYDNTVTQDIKEEISNSKTPYNIFIPLLLSFSLYWIPYLLCIKKCKRFSLVKFNAFWNSILFLLLFIPGILFGIFMILRYKLASLWNIDFNFMYWHVELSLVMGLLALNHFIQRIKIYFSQLRK
ncbi:hypothetical protein A2400_02085 [candidate division WS6 bacterium RIFOXYB1_FULL_33_14]|uniref:Cytochrome b5 heme-binding domain-containing protein n=1 Tax=candidate division WS6 bacterium RIFOXYB1_FULL_33_14 TaxID=1817896 RepID=A0A1F4UFZ4_9BACT|nr:MAG: hypothetical protein A2400_02085 [candidate division WS6 bacterium RIFOXYB1_FULL_33_14]